MEVPPYDYHFFMVFLLMLFLSFHPDGLDYLEHKDVVGYDAQQMYNHATRKTIT